MTPDYSNLMLTLEDPELKNQVVSLDESGRQKNPDDVELALHELLRGFVRRDTERDIKRQQASLQGQQLDEQQELSVLMGILEKKKKTD